MLFNEVPNVHESWYYNSSDVPDAEAVCLVRMIVFPMPGF